MSYRFGNKKFKQARKEAVQLAMERRSIGQAYIYKDSGGDWIATNQSPIILNEHFFYSKDSDDFFIVHYSGKIVHQKTHKKCRNWMVKKRSFVSIFDRRPSNRKSDESKDAFHRRTTERKVLRW